MRRPLREYEDILRFVENFEIIQKEVIKSENPEDIAQGIEPEPDKFLPSSKDISRIEEKYNNLMGVVFPNEEKVSTPLLNHNSIPNPQERRTRILQNIPYEFTAEDIAKLFDGNRNDKNQLLQGAYRDIHWMLDKKKIKYIMGSNPKAYRMINRKLI